MRSGLFRVGSIDNCYGCVVGVLHEDLRLFLETNVPKSTKKLKSVVGVGDNRIAGAISEELGLNMMQSEVVLEIIRGTYPVGTWVIYPAMAVHVPGYRVL